jgi:DNA-binding SARP family transcriptional activator
VEFAILGPLEAVADSAPVALGPHKQRAVLSVLLLHANTVVPVDRLVDAVWGDRPPSSAPKLVQVYISQLRRALEQAGAGAVLQTRAPGYVVTVATEELDASRFVALLEEARRCAGSGELDRASTLYEEALALWRGPVLADVKLEAAGLSAADRLDELRLAAFSERAECELARGRHLQLVPELEKLTSEHPLHEHYWAQLMLALYRCGRQSEALAAYQRARRALADEVGLSPSRELRQLEREILAHDPALELSGPARLPAAVAAESPSSLRRRPAAALALVGVVAAAAAVAIVLTRDTPVKPLARLATNSIGVVDPEGDALIGEISFATRPAAIAVVDGSLWVAMEDDETLLRLDPQTRRVMRTIGVGGAPIELAGAGGSLWVLCEWPTTVVQVDTGTNTVVRTIRLKGLSVGGFRDGRPPPSIAASTNAAWLAAGPGLVTRIDAATGRVEHLGSGFAVAVTVGGGAVWTVGSALHGESAGVRRIDPHTRRVIENVPPPNGPLATFANGIAANGRGVWVIDEHYGIVWKVDPDLAQVKAITRVHGAVAVSIGEGAVWTANNDGTVTHLDAGTGARLKTIPLGNYPRIAYPVDVAAGEGAVWVAVH